MHTPVFLDQLPDGQSLLSHDKTEYQLRRNRSLADLRLDPAVVWSKRPQCPGCGVSHTRSAVFSLSHLEMRRCDNCNTIYAASVPPQGVLDSQRLVVAEAMAHHAPPDRRFEFISYLNWISMTEARLGMRLDTVLDVRFATQAHGWTDTAATFSHNRRWLSYALTPNDGQFDDLAQLLQSEKPAAILIPAEMDRVADPRKLLSVIRETARPGTLVFVTTSCADGLEYEILGAESPSFIPLDRLTLFSVSGFKHLSETLGFDICEVSTPGRYDAVILHRHFNLVETRTIPFWSAFFRDADRDRLSDLQVLLQRSLRSGVMRFVLKMNE